MRSRRGSEGPLARHSRLGIFRDSAPRTGRDPHMEAVLRVGPGAYLTHDAVLALHDLGLVNPRRIRVGTPRRTRRHLPDDVELVQRRVDKADLTISEGIPTTTVRRALLDCRDLVMRERLLDATREAARRGLLRRDQADGVIAEIDAAA